jgi:TRAP-type C4-dicarboxylate transport system permease small subunit
MSSEATKNPNNLMTGLRTAFWRAAETIALFCFSLMFVIMLLQVLSRYVLKIGMPWTDEAARFLFLWSTFLGAAIAQRTNSHIRVSILADRLKGKIKQIVGIAVDAINTVVSIIIVIGTVLMMKKTYGILASSIPISYSWIYLSLALGLSIILVLLLTDIVKKIV